ncbi:MAG: 1-acyl-sn-glycerol-3-phosphate acyltransferase [Prevotellaceae bacterium]|jgi:1-acyl-sn-glycerol-3-phosphate acyltransferase|nr:1-acyl-sn-glycerol-3-phosphate acyltransferase [Prevotellaceae bacterium]
MKLIYNIIVYLYFIVLSITFLLLSAIVLVIFYPFDKRRFVVHKLSKWWMYQCFFFLNPFWKTIFTGKELVDKNKSYIIISNHQSLIDIGLMYYIPCVFKWISKREALSIPIIGQMLYIHGDILIRRGRSDSAKKMLYQSKKWIERGVSIAIFPEGTRTQDGQVHRFKEGAFLLAKQTKTPILPVVLDGAFAVLPKNEFLLKIKHRFHLKILPEISVQEIESTSIKDMMLKVQTLITDEHKKIAPAFYE